MKSLKFAVPLVLALLVSASVRAEDKKEDAKKFVGLVEKAPADAKAGVVALLKVDDKTTLNLVVAVTDKDLTAQVTKLVGKNVEVTGTEVKTNVTVKSIKEQPAAPPAKK